MSVNYDYWGIGALVADPGGIALKVVNQASATGTSSSYPFALPPRPDGSARELWLASLETGSFSGLAVDVKASFDRGTTWVTWQAAVDVHGKLAKVNTPPSAALLIVSVATFSNGSSADVLASCN